MSTNKHSPIVNGASNDAATWNNPLGQLDAAISAIDSEVVVARQGSANLATRINSVVTGYQVADAAEATTRYAADNALNGRIDNLIITSGDSSPEVADARLAGNTDGSSPAVLRDRIAWIAANAYHPMAYGATGDGTTDDRDTLNTLFGSTMSAGGYAVIDRAYSVQSALTVPANVGLVFRLGGKFDIGKFSIRSAAYKWTASAAGTNEYYLELAAGGDPGISTPTPIYIDGSLAPTRAIGQLQAGEVAYGDGDSLGFRTVYVRLSDGTDPDTKATDYIEAGAIVTVNGPVEAPKRQIFDGDGGVLWGPGATGAVLPQWFGSWTDSDDAIGINKALMSLGTQGGTVHCPAGVYECSTRIDVQSGLSTDSEGRTLEGDGSGTVLQLMVNDTDLLVTWKTANEHMIIRSLTLKGTDRTGTDYALLRVATNYTEVHDVKLIDPPGSGYGIHAGDPVLGQTVFDILMDRIFISLDQNQPTVNGTQPKAGIKFYGCSDTELSNSTVRGGNRGGNDWADAGFKYCVWMDNCSTIRCTGLNHWWHASDHVLYLSGNNGSKTFQGCVFDASGLDLVRIQAEGGVQSRMHYFLGCRFISIKGKQNAADTALTAGASGLGIVGLVRQVQVSNCHFEPYTGGAFSEPPGAGQYGTSASAVKASLGSGSEVPRDIHVNDCNIYESDRFDTPLSFPANMTATVRGTRGIDNNSNNYSYLQVTPLHALGAKMTTPATYETFLTYDAAGYSSRRPYRVNIQIQHSGTSTSNVAVEYHNGTGTSTIYPLDALGAETSRGAGWYTVNSFMIMASDAGAINIKGYAGTVANVSFYAVLEPLW